MTLIQSNPCSTVVIKQDHSVEEPTFQRIYVCLSAHNISFMAGCRSVIGLDGCFFQGVTNGELLCAITKDANKQMYPLVWAIVEKECNDS